MHSTIENLQVGLEALRAIPEATINLDFFKQDAACGTLYCAAGLMATLPHFVALGLKWELIEYRQATVLRCNGQPPSNSVPFFVDLFGPEAFSNLFSVYGCGARDSLIFGMPTREIDYENPPMTDRQLAIRRFEVQLASEQERLANV